MLRKVIEHFGYSFSELEQEIEIAGIDRIERIYLEGKV